MQKAPALALASILFASGCATNARMAVPPGEEGGQFVAAIAERGQGITAPNSQHQDADPKPSVDERIAKAWNRSHISDLLCMIPEGLDFEDPIDKALNELKAELDQGKWS